jgi:hypothetical protein
MGASGASAEAAAASAGAAAAGAGSPLAPPALFASSTTVAIVSLVSRDDNHDELQRGVAGAVVVMVTCRDLQSSARGEHLSSGLGPKRLCLSAGQFWP